MKFRHHLFARMYRRPEPGEDGAGDTVINDPAPLETADPAPSADPAPAAAVDGAKPANMLEAMFPETKTDKPAGTGPAKPDATKDGEKPLDPNKPEDLTAMPEGLTPKAQERFQKLANVNKELSTNVQRQTSQLEYFGAAFKENGVQQPQFEQAMSVIGLINRGEFEQALQVLDQQRQQISLRLGRPLPGVDALEGHADLRERVDAMLMTEADAIQVARARASENAIAQGRERQQQQQREQQQQRNTQQQAEKAFDDGQKAVDAFCADKMKTDLDYAQIEAKLLPRIQNGLLNEIPPHRWAAVVKETYDLIKETAGQFKNNSARPGSGTPNTLRPNGSGEQHKAAPQTMFDAMWNRK